MNILIIGNGFDLAHKLPTSYKDFLNYIKQINTEAQDKDNVYVKQMISGCNLNILTIIQRHVCQGKITAKLI